MLEEEGTQVLLYQEAGDLSFLSGKAEQPTVVRVNNNQSCIAESRLGPLSEEGINEREFLAQGKKKGGT